MIKKYFKIKFIIVLFLLFLLTHYNITYAFEFNNNPNTQLENLLEKWNKNSTEVIIQFKNLANNDISQIENHLNYMFLSNKEMYLITDLLLKSGLPKTINIIFNLLKKCSFENKKYIISIIGQHIDSFDKNISNISFKILEQIANTFEKSNEEFTFEIYVDTILTIGKAKNNNLAKKYFIEKFKNEKNISLKLKMLYYISKYDDGLNILKDEFEKYSEKDIPYTCEILKTIATFKNDDSFNFLYNIVEKNKQKFQTNHLTIYNLAYDLIFTYANEKLWPNIESLLTSNNLIDIHLGIKFLNYYPIEKINSVETIYKKINNLALKQVLLDEIIMLLNSKKYNKINENSIVSIYYFILEGLNSNLGKTQKNAFLILNEYLKNEQFKALVLKNKPQHFLISLALFLNGDYKYFLDEIKKDKNEEIIIYVRTLGDILRFNLNFESLQTQINNDTILPAFLKFVCLQTEYVRNYLIEQLLKNAFSKNDFNFVKKVIDFTKNLDPEFIKQIKNILIQNIKNIDETKIDKSILDFCEYEKNYYFQLKKEALEKIKISNNDLKKYLLLLKNYRTEEYNLAFDFIYKNLKENPKILNDIITDDNYPTSAKITFLQFCSDIIKKFNDIKLDANALYTATTNSNASLELLNSIIWTLINVNPELALKSLENLNFNYNTYYITTIIRQYVNIKSDDCAKALINKLLIPTLNVIFNNNITIDDAINTINNLKSSSNENDKVKYEILNTTLNVLYDLNKHSNKFLINIINEKPYLFSLFYRFNFDNLPNEVIKYLIENLNKTNSNDEIIKFLFNNISVTNIDCLKDIYIKTSDVKIKFLVATLLYKLDFHKPILDFLKTNPNFNEIDFIITTLKNTTYNIITSYYEFNNILNQIKKNNNETKHLLNIDYDFSKRYQFSLKSDENYNENLNIKKYLDKSLDQNLLQEFKKIVFYNEYLIIDKSDEKTILELIKTSDVNSEIFPILIKLCQKYNLKETFALIAEKVEKYLTNLNISNNQNLKINEIIENIILCLKIENLEQWKSLINKLFNQKIIDTSFYFTLLNTFYLELDFKQLEFSKLKFKEQFTLISKIINESYCLTQSNFLNNFQIIIKFLEPTSLFILNEKINLNVIDEIINIKLVDKTYDLPQYYVLKLVKLKNTKEQLEYFIKILEENKKSNIGYYIYESLSNFLKFYSSDEFKKEFSNYFFEDIKNLSLNEELTKLATIYLQNKEKIFELINKNLKSDSKVNISSIIFEALTLNYNETILKKLEELSQSNDYYIKGYALDAITKCGNDGLKILQKLFETYHTKSQNYDAIACLNRITTIKTSESFQFLKAILLDKNFKQYHNDIINNLNFKTKECVELLINLFSNDETMGYAFNTLKNMCYEMIPEILDYIKNENNLKVKLLLYSILFQNDVKTLFLNAILNNFEEMRNLNENFLPSSYTLEKEIYSLQISQELIDKITQKVSLEINNFLKNPKEYEKFTNFYRYLCYFLAFTNKPEDINLLINLLENNNFSYVASYVLKICKLKDTSLILAKKASDSNNSVNLQKQLLNILIERNYGEAKDLYLYALTSNQKELQHVALNAVTKFKITEAIDVLIENLANSSKDEYEIISCLTSFKEKVFYKLLSKLLTIKQKYNIYLTLKRIVENMYYDKTNKELIKNELLNSYDKINKSSDNNDTKIVKLLIASLLAKLENYDLLINLLNENEDILILLGNRLFDYISYDTFLKLDKIATIPLMKVFEQKDESYTQVKSYILDIMSKIKDPKVVPYLSAFIKDNTVKDHYLKRQAMDIIGQLSKNSFETWFNVLINDNDYYMKQKAAQNILQMSEVDETYCNEILKLVKDSKIDDRIKVILIEILAKSKYKNAISVLLEILKNSNNYYIIEAASNALIKIGELSIMRNILKSIILDLKNEINKIHAIKIITYLSDTESIDVINLALENAINNGSSHLKLELINAAISLKSEKFLKNLSKLTTDLDEHVRENAQNAILTIDSENGLKYCAPNPPQNLTAQPDDQTIELKWNAPQNKPISYYEIYRDNQLIKKVTNCYFKDTNLKNGKKYQYKIRACDTDSNFSTFSTCEAMPATAPNKISNFKIEKELTYLILKWDYEPKHSNEIEIKYFVIERDNKQIATLSANTKQYYDYGLSANKVYVYSIYAVNQLGIFGEKTIKAESPHFNFKTEGGK